MAVAGAGAPVGPVAGVEAPAHVGVFDHGGDVVGEVVVQPEALPDHRQAGQLPDGGRFEAGPGQVEDRGGETDQRVDGGGGLVGDAYPQVGQAAGFGCGIGAGGFGGPVGGGRIGAGGGGVPHEGGFEQGGEGGDVGRHDH